MRLDESDPIDRVGWEGYGPVLDAVYVQVKFQEFD